MPYVNVPNDLSKIKTKIAFNLTKRQLICFGAGAVIGVPTYLLTRQAIGNTGALFAMLAIMLPAFLLACQSACTLLTESSAVDHLAAALTFQTNQRIIGKG